MTHTPRICAICHEPTTGMMTPVKLGDQTLGRVALGHNDCLRQLMEMLSADMAAAEAGE
ncbi:hypothetical protein [Streptacidiphilus sp. EB129]|uniref:hypothetical protein n=1 Tax=Streptacidiphilus sp. EB129 TaxID=3156262 RepID=UPI003515013D